MPMHYRFDVHISEEDYFEFNKFFSFKSTYGQKEYKKLLVAMITLPLLLALFVIAAKGFTLDAVIDAIPYVILSVICFFGSRPMMIFVLKQNLKQLKKNGKLPYSPEATLEFYDDHFTEETPDGKSEVKYTAIEAVSVIGIKIIYLHTSSVGAHLLPYADFKTKDQYDEFIKFISEKTKPAEFYDGKI